MASLMDTAFPSREDYAKQIKNYDAGRPSTPTDTKPGTDVYVPNFDPSADAKGLAQRPSLTNIPDKQGRTAGGNLRNFLSIPMSAGLDHPDTPIAATTPVSASSQPVASNATPVVERAPLTQSNNAYSGKYAAQDANGQGIYQDPVTGRKSIRLTGDEGSKFMASRMPLTTARPGEGTLSASTTPVERKPLSTSPLAGMNGVTNANATDAALFNARMNQIKNSDSMSKPGTAWGDLNQKQLEDFQKNAVASTRDRLAAELDTKRINAALTGQQLPEERNSAMVDDVQRAKRHKNEIFTNERLSGERALSLDRDKLAQADNQFETSTRLAENRDATDRYVADQNLARENARGRTELQQEAIKQAGEMKRQGDPTMKARWDAFSKEIDAMRAAQDERADDPEFIDKLKQRYQLSNAATPGKVTTETL